MRRRGRIENAGSAAKYLLITDAICPSDTRPIIKPVGPDQAAADSKTGLRRNYIANSIRRKGLFAGNKVLQRLGRRNHIDALLTCRGICVIGIEVGHDVVFIDIRGVPVITEAQVHGKPRVYADIILPVITGFPVVNIHRGTGNIDVGVLVGRIPQQEVGVPGKIGAGATVRHRALRSVAQRPKAIKRLVANKVRAEFE